MSISVYRCAYVFQLMCVGMLLQNTVRDYFVIGIFPWQLSWEPESAMARLDPLGCVHGADGRLNIVEMLNAGRKLERPLLAGVGERGGRRAGCRAGDRRAQAGSWSPH